MNQPSSFGSVPPAPVTEVAEEAGGTGRRTVVIAVAAGVLALGVLGGAAALVLSGDPGDTGEVAAPLAPAPVTSVEPSADPTSVAATPLPTAVFKGRNIFVPLVEDKVEASGAASDAPADGSQPTGGVPGGVPGDGSYPTAFPTSGTGSGGGVGLPGGGGWGSLPEPVVTETVLVPGPTVTVTGPGRTLPGPTKTVEVEKPVEIEVPGAKSVVISVYAVEVDDEEAPGGTRTQYLADFVIDDTEYLARPESDELFGPRNAFQYISYAPISRVLTFRYGSALFNVTVPLSPPPPPPEDPAP